MKTRKFRRGLMYHVSVKPKPVMPHLQGVEESKDSKEKSIVAKTTGYIYTDEKLSKQQVLVHYSNQEGLETLSLSDGVGIQISVSYGAVKEIIARAK